MKNFSMGSRHLLRSIVILCCYSLAGTAAIDAKQPISFAKHVAPIFSRHCIRCHSSEKSRGDISLSTPVSLKAGKWIIVGDPDRSALMQLVTESNGKTPAMPKRGEPLSVQELAVLRQWIREGAKWPKGFVVRENARADASWWAYQPLQKTTLSKVAQIPDGNPIDRFVFARLAAAGLKPSRRASRRTLIRRLSFHLHGLPPAPEAVEAFVQSADPMAYEKLVDQMLASPNYGERFAQHWLDLAHYADTHGFERDKRRDHAWHYRDYVIQAFNEDKPYDRFLQEQIAGDVLWPTDPQAVTATGFLAAGPWDFVGQVETKSPVLRRAARSLDLDDMATQVMATTMAMTVNCARCHDHKLDPISQKEYYQLRAVFAGLRRQDRMTGGQFQKERQVLTATIRKLDGEIGKLQGAGIDLADIVGGGNGYGTGAYRQGIDARNGAVQSRNLNSLRNVKTNNFVRVKHDFVDGVFIPNGNTSMDKVPVSSTGLTVMGLPTTGGQAWDIIRNGPVASQHSNELGGIDFTKDGHTLLGLHANAGITFDLAKIRRATGQQKLRFTAKLGYFGAKGAFRADAWIAIDGKIVAEHRQLKRADGLREIDIQLPQSTRFLTLISTDGGNGYSHDQIGFGDPKLQFDAPSNLSTADRKKLEYLHEQRAVAHKSMAKLIPPHQFFGVVINRKSPPVRLLQRGNPEAPVGPPLAPTAFSALAMLKPDLGGVQSDHGQRRAAMARWITHTDNPLTRRVIVNRLWQWCFGHGLVRTPSDFGFGGSRPSHPLLLDWLAAELPRRKWSLKAMLRLILTSATYQQASRSVAGEKMDQDNRLLWRQNPQRLDAEAIRDAVLFVSGKLNPQRGGPGYENFRYKEAYAPIYTYITADEPRLWKRCIYRYIVRTTPNGFLTTLDCPDPANLTPKRVTTTTPLQSLTLYNNEFVLKQAQYFAERIRFGRKNSLPETQVRRAFALAFGRQPSQPELQLSMAFLKKHGLFALCRSLFNANEFIYVD